MTTLRGALAAAALAALAPPALAEARNVVLVHGAVLDGSTWRAVHDLLVEDGLDVTVAQLPLTSLADDVAAVERVLAPLDGPVVLVGQSYGGAVVTVAGTDPDVAALVYVAALQPDKGETVAELNMSMPSPVQDGDVLFTEDGLLYVNPDRFGPAIAADLPEADVRFLARSQTPTAPEVFTTPLPAAAWRDKPSWAVVATEDRNVNPDLQRWMYDRSGATVTEVAASHLVHMSEPRAVADVIAEAARAAE